MRLSYGHVSGNFCYITLVKLLKAKSFIGIFLVYLTPHINLLLRFNLGLANLYTSILLAN